MIPQKLSRRESLEAENKDQGVKNTVTPVIWFCSNKELVTGSSKSIDYGVSDVPVALILTVLIDSLDYF